MLPISASAICSPTRRLLHEATFDTADDQDHLDLDLFDKATFAALRR